MLGIGLSSYPSCAFGVGREEDGTGIFTMCVEIGRREAQSASIRRSPKHNHVNHWKENGL